MEAPTPPSTAGGQEDEPKSLTLDQINNYLSEGYKEICTKAGCFLRKEGSSDIAYKEIDSPLEQPSTGPTQKQNIEEVDISEQEKSKQKYAEALKNTIDGKKVFIIFSAEHCSGCTALMNQLKQESLPAKTQVYIFKQKSNKDSQGNLITGQHGAALITNTQLFTKFKTVFPNEFTNYELPLIGVLSKQVDANGTVSAYGRFNLGKDINTIKSNLKSVKVL